MPIDRELVTRKIALILGDLPDLRRMARLDRAAFLDDRTHQLVAERLLELVIGLPADLANALAPAAGLRNLLAHEYNEIDYQKLHQALGETSTMIPRYLEAVRASVET
jgi:uncharacterized protein YutE (UPF0331/DUF86 family)